MSHLKELQCTPQARQALASMPASIRSRLNKQKKKIETILSEPRNILETPQIEALQKEMNSSDFLLSQIYSDADACISYLNSEDWPSHFNEKAYQMYCDHPFFFAFYLLGKDLSRFEDCGFADSRSFAQAITVSTLNEHMEQWMFSYRQYLWQEKDRQNLVTKNGRGDAAFLQATFPQDHSLFPQTKGALTQSVAKVKINIFGFYQDWKQFLILVLLYAKEHDQLHLPAISNWKKTQNDTPYMITHASDGAENLKDHDIELLFSRTIAQVDSQLKNLPIIFYTGSEEVSYIPLLDGEDLIVCVYHKEILSNRRIPPINELEIRARYSTNDIPHLMRSAYQFFARDPNCIDSIMSWFCKKNKI